MRIQDIKEKYKYSEDEIDEIIQRVLDRLIFIRNCEDRGFEEQKLWVAHKEYKDDEVFHHKHPKKVRFFLLLIILILLNYKFLS